ncbi:MAG: hypothetical protein R2828_19525 [Saprospiraceae bacterium]
MDTEKTDHPVWENAGESIGYLKTYFEQQLIYYRLKLVEYSAKMLSFLITSLVIFLMTLLVVGFGGITLGFYLAQLLDSYVLGFLVVTLLFCGLLLLILLFRQRIITNPIVTLLIQQLH